MSYPTVDFTDALGAGGASVSVPGGGTIRSGSVSQGGNPGLITIEITVTTPLAAPPVINVYTPNGSGWSVWMSLEGQATVGTQVMTVVLGNKVIPFLVEVVNFDPANSFAVAAQWAGFTPGP